MPYFTKYMDKICIKFFILFVIKFAVKNKMWRKKKLHDNGEAYSKYFKKNFTESFLFPMFIYILNFY